MKLTAEEKAALKAKRLARKAELQPVIAKGGNEASAAAIEGVIMSMDERFEATDESEAEMRDELKSHKADLEKVMSALKSRKAGKTTEGMDVKQFDIGKLVLARAKGIFNDSADGDGVGFELECMEEASKGVKNLSKKDIISSLTSGSGGAPLPVQVSGTIVEAARSQSALFSLGVNNMSLEGLSAFSVPYEVTSANGVGDGVIMAPGMVGEAGAITMARNGFKLANFTPRKLAMIIGMTSDYLKQGGGFVRDFVNRVASGDMRNQLERFCLSGQGQQYNEPQGLLRRSDMTATTITLPTDGRALTFADLNDMEIDLAEANRLTDTCGYLTRTAVLRGLRKQTATYGLSGADASNSRPITDMQFLSLKKLGDYVGYNLKWTTNVPKNFKQGATTTASHVLFGDYSHVWIPFWGPMEIEMTKEGSVGGVSAFENYLFYVRFLQMFDTNIVAPDALTKVSGFKTQGF